MEYRSAFKRYLLTGDDTEVRAASDLSGSGGGYLVPEEFQAHLAVSLKRYGVLFSDYTPVETDNGRVLKVPAVSPATEGDALPEDTQARDNDRVFGNVTLGAYPIHSDVYKMSIPLEQDTGIPIEQVFAETAGEALGRKLSDLSASGSGTSEPYGIYAASSTSTQVVKPTSATPVTIDGAASTELAAKIYAPSTFRAMLAMLDSAYWPTAAWYMSGTQVTALMGVTDSAGQPLLRPNGPLVLYGLPIKVANEITDIAASTVSGPVLGSMSHGWFFRSAGIRIQRMPQRFADFGQVGYQAYMRADLRPRDTRAWVAVEASST